VLSTHEVARFSKRPKHFVLTSRTSCLKALRGSTRIMGACLPDRWRYRGLTGIDDKILKEYLQRRTRPQFPQHHVYGDHRRGRDAALGESAASLGKRAIKICELCDNVPQALEQVRVDSAARTLKKYGAFSRFAPERDYARQPPDLKSDARKSRAD
jgi:hypothetical protein